MTSCSCIVSEIVTLCATADDSVHENSNENAQRQRDVLSKKQLEDFVLRNKSLS